MSQFDCRRPGETPLDEMDLNEARIARAEDIAEVERTSGRGFLIFRLVLVALFLLVAVSTYTAQNWSTLFGATPTLNELQQENPNLLDPTP